MTLQSLIDCAKREAAMRRRVYTRRIEAGKMDPDKAQPEIAAMDEIADRLTKLQALGREWKADRTRIADPAWFTTLNLLITDAEELL